MPEFQTAYSDVVRPVTINKKPSMTKQHLKDEADVNKIIKRYGLAQIQQNAAMVELQYGEITSMSLQEAIDMVEKANEAFLTVPSEIRAKFNNDAGAWIDYATNPANLDELVKLGLASPKEEP